jgi:outer membrane murein-binding lipoprotein Lpp
VSHSRVRLLLAVVGVSLVVTGCSSSKIERDELESQAAAALEAEIGALPDVTCGEDLAAEVDATTECVAVAPGSDEELPIRITVTSVEDGQADFTIEPVD